MYVVKVVIRRAIAMETLVQSLWFMAVALLWGATNPLMKKGSAGIENISCSSRILQLVMEVKFLALRWQYAVPFLLNQSGSLLYYLTLSQADISLAVPITNSLTFLITSLVSRLLGEKVHSNWTYVGMILVLSGVALCVASKLT